VAKELRRKKQKKKKEKCAEELGTAPQDIGGLRKS
jgi:hypothetical protein